MKRCLFPKLIAATLFVSLLTISVTARADWLDDAASDSIFNGITLLPGLLPVDSAPPTGDPIGTGIDNCSTSLELCVESIEAQWRAIFLPAKEVCREQKFAAWEQCDLRYIRRSPEWNLCIADAEEAERDCEYRVRVALYPTLVQGLGACESACDTCVLTVLGGGAMPAGGYEVCNVPIPSPPQQPASSDDGDTAVTEE